MKSTPTQLVTWYRLEDYSRIYPTRSGVVLLAVTNLKTEYSDVAEGQISRDDDGNLHWHIDSIGSVRMLPGGSIHGFTKDDFKIDFWADALAHPRYLSK